MGDTTKKVTDAVKNAASNVKDAVSGKDSKDHLSQLEKAQKESGEVTNDSHDYNPPGSESAVNRGVPNKVLQENSKGSATVGRPASTVQDSAIKPDYADKVVLTKPYTEHNPLQEARLQARMQNAVDNAPAPQTKKSGKTIELNAKTVARVIQLSDGLDQSAQQEINAMFKAVGVSEEGMQYARNLLKHPELFSGDQKPGNLQELSLPPGAQKVREFDVAPGQPALPEDRYYPTRYPSNPDDDDFEAGDLVYCVLEDQSFMVLSVAQQTTEYQQAHAMPRCNVIRRVGGREFSDVPKEVLKSGLQVKQKDAE
jgi:hypothetical protein